MTPRRVRQWLVVACVCALGALALMTWQIIDPTVWPVMVAMSLGQVLGTASFAAFGYVVLADYRARHRADVASDPRPIERH
jgi:uncharacterized membrane protein YbhN (UPF0104 family)